MRKPEHFAVDKKGNLVTNISGQKVVIRRINPRSKSEFAQVSMLERFCGWAKEKGKYYYPTNQKEFKLWAKKLRGDIRDNMRLVRKKKVEILVAMTGDKVAGYHYIEFDKVLYDKNVRDIIFGGTVVHPAFARQGLGTILTARRDALYNNIHIFSLPVNPGGAKIMKRLGGRGRIQINESAERKPVLSFNTFLYMKGKRGKSLVNYKGKRVWMPIPKIREKLKIRKVK